MTLRLPRDLHARIADVDGASSLNATIVNALEEQFPRPAAEKLESLKHELDDLMNSDNPHKDKLAQLYDWGLKVLEKDVRTEKRRVAKK